MKRLFTEDGRWGDSASEFSAELTNAMRPVIQKWIALGWDIRDIQLIALSDAGEVAVEEILQHQTREYKKNLPIRAKGKYDG